MAKVSSLVKQVAEDFNQHVKFTSTALDLQNEMIVTVREGKLKGSKENLLDGSTYFSFKGIPYARPPVGDLRFTAPQPPEPWQGIHDATKHGPVCPQIDVTTGNLVEGDENCLFLNVYTKSLSSKSKQPVMVYVHGGAYMTGSGNALGLGPEFLLQHDVVLVTLNFRLEALGFLTLDTPEVPGNAGMKDQVAALKWVKNNIKKFGGDPDNVTLFGESAGGTSVTFHTESRMSKGLFHKAIAQSGVSIVDGAQGKDGKARAFRLGKLLGKDTNNVTELLEFLRSLPAIKLANVTTATMTTDEERRGLLVHFAPVAEKKFRNVESFLTDEPLDILVDEKVNKVPILLGYNSAEGIFMLADYLTKVDFYNKNPEYLVPREIANKVSTDDTKIIGEKIKEFFVGSGNFDANTSLAIIHLTSDLNFVYSTHRFAHFYSKISKRVPVFMYRFSLDTALNVVKILSGLSHFKGACHADDLYYLFYNQWNKKAYEDNENLQEIVYRVTKLWTDFAKTGNPTPSGADVAWPKYTVAGKEFFDINKEFTSGTFAEKNRVEFWDKLYCDSNPVVTVKQGQLRGAANKLYDGSSYYSFKGIQYAQPPIGDLRFKAPKPPLSWKGIRDAIEHGPFSPQYDFMTRQTIEGDEDCLFLNVYTKSLSKNTNTPVMVFIHGGAFSSGSGNDFSYGPKFLLQHDVVLVTINYRLELLGFLCLDTPQVPGNAGMKDQVAALKWVQANIGEFGGDPDNVTLFGESAGASSVAYHMKSPMSKGLFQKAICQSGTSIVDWAQGKDSLNRAFRAAKYLGKVTNDVKELYDFLKTVPAEKFTNITFRSMTQDEKYRGLPIHFAPVIEKRFDNVEPFLTEDLFTPLLQKTITKMPIILGYNNIESLLMLQHHLKQSDFINKHPQYLVPRAIAQVVTEDKMIEFGHRIMKFYFGDNKFDKETLPGMIDMLSDLHFVYAAHRFAYFYSLIKEAVYMYRFCLDTDLNIVKKLSGMSEIKGSCHADDLFYLFHSPLNNDAYEEQDKLKDIVYRLTKLWTDFAKTGNPTPEGSPVKWPQYIQSSPAVLDLDETFTPRSFAAEKERIEFWNKLYQEVGLPCIVKSNL